MNYLSHQAVAREVDSKASPWFYVGNLLPDLLGVSGDGRVRDLKAPTGTVADERAAALLSGMRLHIATDRRFHGLPAFKEASAEATRLLKEAPFSTPPRRLFFIAHVAVELALDARLLAQRPALADDLYAQMDACFPETLAALTTDLLAIPTPNLAHSFERFRSAGFLRDYSTPEGLTEAMLRVGSRAGLSDFTMAEDINLLTAAMAELTERLAPWQIDLLTPPAFVG